jgi:hypothetical protein
VVIFQKTWHFAVLLFRLVILAEPVVWPGARRGLHHAGHPERVRGGADHPLCATQEDRSVTDRRCGVEVDT